MTIKQLTVDHAKAKIMIINLTQTGRTWLRIEINKPKNDKGIRQ